MVLRASALSLGLACAGALLPAAAQTAPVETASERAPAEKPAARKATSQKKTVAKKPAEEQHAIDEVDPGQPVSESVVSIAGWIIASGDNRGLPFAIVDKSLAQVLVFGKDGKLKGLAPVLIGSAIGDESAPGVGDRELSDIPQDERTTPAGRYVAGYGPAVGGDTVLWVDYATAVSIHPIQATRASRKEKRQQRLASATPEDNRITHGCINVSPGFYSRIVQPTFRKGGVFYVLPDSGALQTAFPAFLPASEFASAGEETKASFSRPPPKPAKKRPAKKPAARKPATGG